jgi:hypothetical protein
LLNSVRRISNFRLRFEISDLRSQIQDLKTNY